MKAMVLAAGQGQRLRPLTEKIPKALVPVARRPMIEYPLLLLRHYGICEIVINLHHLGDQLEDYLGDGASLGLQIHYSREAELLDTGGGLLKARSFLDDGTFIVINTDVLIDLPVTDMIAYHHRHGAVATLALRPDPLAEQYGSMEIESDGRICRFLHARRPSVTTCSGPALMFTGVQILEPRIFDYMPVNSAPRKFGTTKDTYPKMLLAEEKLYGYRFDGFWLDLGTPLRIKEAEEKLSQGKTILHYLS